jgi:hypothetical protein
MRRQRHDHTWRNPFEIPGFLFSLFIHAIVIQCLGLTFSHHPPQHNPSLVFLGAILDTFDVSQLPAQYRLTNMPEKSLITIKDRATAFSPAKVIAVSKPHFPQRFQESQRLFLKSLFDKSQEWEAAGDAPANIPWEQYGISPHPFSYTPLKLKLQ